MRSMTFSELKTCVASWPRGLVFAGLLVLWLLGQIALGGSTKFSTITLTLCLL